jgi:predicted nucleic acid binding AN1-type Zn finger protein
MTDAYLIQLRIELAAQVRVATRGTPTPCHECSNPVPLFLLYRCLYCGFWFCKRHAREHFELEDFTNGGER